MDSTQEYYKEVNSIVDAIEYEYNEYPDSELSELVFESVDSSQLIIYTSYHLDILQYSRNEPSEWKHLVGESDGYRQVIQAMAYDVLRMDVWEEINERDIDY
jgi:hypothetical protein